MPLAASVQSNLRAFSAFTSRLSHALDAPVTNGGGLRGGAVEAAHRYAAFTLRRFDSASAGDGTWAPVKPRSKKTQTAARRILFVSGRLRQGLVPGSSENVIDLLPDRVRYTTTVPYTRFHQRGGGNLPRRAVLVAPEGDALANCIEPIVQAFRKLIHDYSTPGRMAA